MPSDEDLSQESGPAERDGDSSSGRELAAQQREPEEEPLDEDTGGPLRVFLGLFLVPLLVVLLCVAIFIGFGWIAYDRHTTSDYLNDLRSSWRPRRAQAAYELSKILIADPAAMEDQPEVRAEMRKFFQEAEDPEMRKYLALVLGYTGDPEAGPLLVEALDEADSEMRIYALWALGALGDPQALEPLLESLGDEDPGIRKTAAYALGEIGERAALEPLAVMLEDPVADVRWNAALALARLGSGNAIPVLRQMVDRSLVSQVPEITPAQADDVMIGAVAALAALQDSGSRDLLESLAREDPSLKVRQAAIDALESYH